MWQKLVLPKCDTSTHARTHTLMRVLALQWRFRFFSPIREYLHLSMKIKKTRFRFYLSIIVVISTLHLNCSTSTSPPTAQGYRLSAKCVPRPQFIVVSAPSRWRRRFSHHSKDHNGIESPQWLLAVMSTRYIVGADLWACIGLLYWMKSYNWKKCLAEMIIKTLYVVYLYTT